MSKIRKQKNWRSLKKRVSVILIKDFFYRAKNNTLQRLPHYLCRLLFPDLKEVRVNNLWIIWQEVWLLTIKINGKWFPISDTMYWYFISFSGENGSWTNFFCINLVIMLAVMRFAWCISHYAGFKTHSKLSNSWVASNSLCVELLIWK